ncbi:hypothetical protein V8E54_006075 [Elaphomyces granulatus]
MAKLKYRFKGSLRTISPTVFVDQLDRRIKIDCYDGKSRRWDTRTQRTRRTSNSGNHSDSASGLHTPTSEVRSTEGRSTDERSKAVRRDQGRCLVTKAGAYNQVAHIYPYCLGARFTGVSRDMFWSSLFLFWTKDQIKSWKDVILAHVYWGKALFVLKPISLSKDKRTLEVGLSQEFYTPGRPHSSEKDFQETELSWEEAGAYDERRLESNYWQGKRHNLRKLQGQIRAGGDKERHLNCIRKAVEFAFGVTAKLEQYRFAEPLEIWSIEQKAIDFFKQNLPGRVRFRQFCMHGIACKAKVENRGDSSAGRKTTDAQHKIGRWS